MFLQILGYVFIVSKTESGKSLGCGEVNRILISGNSLAKASSKSANLGPWPSLNL